MDFNKQKTWTIWYIIAAVFAALLLQQIWNTSRQTEAIPYSKFEQLVTDKKIAEVVIDSDMIEGTAQGARAGRQKQICDNPGRSGDRR